MGAAPTPLFSVITPVFDPPVAALSEMIASVTGQTDPDLELVLVDDRSTRDEVRDVLRAAARADERVRVVERSQNGGIVAASQDAVDAARGGFLVLVDHDDLLAPEALAVVRAAVEAQPDADYLYSDEDKIGADGTRYDLFRKPPWSPERLRSHMYTGHLSVMRTEVVRRVGGFRAGYDGSQDHDLALRVAEAARAVVHVPEVLYHWRVVAGSAAGSPSAKEYAWEAGRRAVADHLERVGVRGTAELGRWPATYRVRRQVDPDRTVSLVVATAGRPSLVWGQERVPVVEAVRSFLARARHPRLEVVVVHDPDTPEPVLAGLRDLARDRLRLVVAPSAPGGSARVNAGVLAASGDVLVLLDEHAEVVTDDVVAELVAPLDDPDVAAVGPQLVGEDGRVVAAGLAHRDGAFAALGRDHDADDPGQFVALGAAREVSALPAACLAVRRDDFEAVGGLSERLSGTAAAGDLSLKLRRAGRRLVWQPAARVYALGPDGDGASSAESAVLARRWGAAPTDLYSPGVL